MADSNIPPAGVRLIREVRGESRTEFADHLGVSPKTIGNWERGDGEPNSENHAAILEVIPGELSIDEVREAEDRLDDDQPRAFDDEKRLFGSDRLQELRAQPRTSEELRGRGMSTFTAQQRQFVRRLNLTSVEGASQRDGERVTTVYFLEGDERRALRRFITENESIVRNQLGSAPNRFSHEWEPFLYGLLEEEWRFWLYES